MTMPVVDRLRLLETDHEPDGWPAVRMRDITELLDAVEVARKDSCLMLVADIRFACGDNGKRLQPDLVEFIRELAADAERLDFVMRNVRGSELRRIGIHTNGGDHRTAIDQARGKRGDHG